MSIAKFVLSAFGDEIGPDFQTQLELLNSLNVHYLEFRSAWGTNVKDLDDSQLAHVKQLCADANTGVSCIGSPIGKSSIEAPLQQEIDNLTRIFTVCDILDTRAIRIFAFYPPKDADPDAYLDESISRLARLTELAAAEGCTLMLENDEDLVADNIERTRAIFSHIDSSHLRFAWDNANFVRSGVPQPTTNAWDVLKPYLGTAHIKDASNDRTQRAAGEGDGEIADLLRHLHDMGYQGFLAVEPHPFIVAGRGELRGPDGMRYAVNALRGLLERLSYGEMPRLN